MKKIKPITVQVSINGPVYFDIKASKDNFTIFSTTEPEGLPIPIELHRKTRVLIEYVIFRADNYACTSKNSSTIVFEVSKINPIYTDVYDYMDWIFQKTLTNEYIR